MYRRKSDNMWCQKIKTPNGYKVVYGRTQRELKEKLKTAPVSVSFESLANEWCDLHCEELSTCAVRRTRVTTRTAIDAFKGMNIDDVRPVDVSRYMAILTQKKGYSHKTAEGYLSTVKMIFRYAITEGYIDFNPVADIRLPSGLRKSRRDLPTAEDIQKIKEHPEGFGLFAMIALYTGLRRGEILALRKDDIDLERRLIYVTKSVQENGRVKMPKTENGIRVVGIPSSLSTYLHPESGYLFHKNGRPLNKGMFERRWLAYQKESGVTCTPHQLRHAYATALYDAGIPPEESQRLLGHADIKTTMNIYTHLKKERAAEIAQKTFDLEPK